MTHIDEGRLQALIDGELRLDERHRAERHLAECAPCRAELEALRANGAHFGAAMVQMHRSVGIDMHIEPGGLRDALHQTQHAGLVIDDE